MSIAATAKRTHRVESPAASRRGRSSATHPVSAAIRSVNQRLGSVGRGLDFDDMDRTHLRELADDIKQAYRRLDALQLAVRRAQEREMEWRKAGCHSPEEWLSRQDGISTGAAKRRMQLDRRLNRASATREAFERGEISLSQADIISDAASSNPDAEADLLRLAEHESNKALADEALRRKAEAEDQEAKQARIHRQRSVRSWTDREGRWNLKATGCVLQGAEIDRLLAAMVDRQFADERRAGSNGSLAERRTRDQHLFDALHEAVSGRAPGATASDAGSAVRDGGRSRDGHRKRPSDTARRDRRGVGSDTHNRRDAETPNGQWFGRGAAEVGRPDDHATDGHTRGRHERDAQAPTDRTRGTQAPGSRASNGCPRDSQTIDGHPPGSPTSDGDQAGPHTTERDPADLAVDAVGVGPDAFLSDDQPEQPPGPTGGHIDRPTASPPPTRPTPKNTVIIRVDLASLVRGQTQGGEVCEVRGVGPISVAQARALLGDSVLKLVLTRGADVCNVTHLGRGTSAAQKIALLWSDTTCRVLGCDRQVVQHDHNLPWSKRQETMLDNIDPLCWSHHQLKTHQGWSLEPGSGRRRFVPPEGSP